MAQLKLSTNSSSKGPEFNSKINIFLKASNICILHEDVAALTDIIGKLPFTSFRPFAYFSSGCSATMDEHSSLSSPLLYE